MSQNEAEPSNSDQTAAEISEAPRRELPPAAKRALAEAEARRKLREQQEKAAAAEVGGVNGPEPTRYGDWEKDGIVSDF